MAMAHGIADRLLGDAQQGVLVLGGQTGGGSAALEAALGASGHRGALGQLAQRQLQAAAAGLIRDAAP
jgi:hypothetical protein